MIDLHSVVLGKGQPFLILHGFLGMGDNWKSLGNKFSEAGFQVHLIDLRNHGKSAHTKEMDYEVMAQDIRNYCEKRNLQEIVLMGHSMGGKVAMKTAGDFPDLIEKLIIVDIAPKYYEAHHQQILEGLTALDEKKLSSRGEAQDFLEKYVNDEGTKLFLLKNLYWKSKGELALRLNLPVLKENYEKISLALPPGLRFKKPTLFIKGGNSAYIKDEDTNLIMLHFPGANIVEIPGAGHWVHAEKMEEFYKAVMDYLQ